MDQSIVQQCQRFNREAQRELYDYAFAKTMTLCLRYSKSQEQANEMFSQGFIKLCLSIGELKKAQDVDIWIQRKMVEHAVSFLRARRQEYFITSTIRLNGEDVMPEFDLFHQQLEPDESTLTTSEYLKALQTLPPSFRAVYNMHVIDGFTEEEISKSLELSQDSCKYNLAKAKEIFYKNLTHIQNPC